MIEHYEISERVDRYVRGELDENAAAALEAELLESPELQDALEVALGVQRAVEFAHGRPADNIVQLSRRGGLAETSRQIRPPWALAASVAIAAVAAVLVWRAEAENARLQSRLAQLEQPVESVLTVPVDVMRSLGSDGPDVRIRKPAGVALLILDVEIAAQLADSPRLDLQLSDANGQSLIKWSSAPDSEGRIQLVLRTDQVPDGQLTLEIRAPDANAVDRRTIELRPAGPLTRE